MTTLACPYCEIGHVTLNSGLATFLPCLNRLNSNKITSDKSVEVSPFLVTQKVTFV